MAISVQLTENFFVAKYCAFFLKVSRLKLPACKALFAFVSRDFPVETSLLTNSESEMSHNEIPCKCF